MERLIVEAAWKIDEDGLGNKSYYRCTFLNGSRQAQDCEAWGVVAVPSVNGPRRNMESIAISERRCDTELETLS